MGGFPKGVSTTTYRPSNYVTDGTFLPYQGYDTTGTTSEEALEYVAQPSPDGSSCSIEIPEELQFLDSISTEDVFEGFSNALWLLAGLSEGMPLPMAAALFGGRVVRNGVPGHQRGRMVLQEQDVTATAQAPSVEGQNKFNRSWRHVIIGKGTEDDVRNMLHSEGSGNTVLSLARRAIAADIVGVKDVPDLMAEFHKRMIELPVEDVAKVLNVLALDAMSANTMSEITASTIAWLAYDLGARVITPKVGGRFVIGSPALKETGAYYDALLRLRALILVNGKMIARESLVYYDMPMLPSSDIGGLVRDTGYNGNRYDPNEFVRYASSVIGSKDVISLYYLAAKVGELPETNPRNFIMALAEIVTEEEMFHSTGNIEKRDWSIAIARAKALAYIGEQSRYWNYLVNGSLESDTSLYSADIRALSNGTGFTGNTLSEFISFAKQRLGEERVDRFIALVSDIAPELGINSLVWRRLVIALSQLMKGSNPPDDLAEGGAMPQVKKVLLGYGAFSNDALALLAILIGRPDAQVALENRIASSYLPVMVEQVSMVGSVKAALAGDLTELGLNERTLRLIEAMSKLNPDEQRTVLSDMIGNARSHISKGSTPEFVAAMVEKYIRFLGGALGIHGSLRGDTPIETIIDNAKDYLSGDSGYARIAEAIGVLGDIYGSVRPFVRR